MRITRPEMFMEMAHTAAKRSTCFRLNVGAVVVVNNRVVSIGYNGAPSGAPHCSGNSCPGRNGCQETIHAEDNALRYVPTGVKPEDLYVTDSPCPHCAELIFGAGVKRVFFGKAYRITEPLEWLTRLNVEVYQVTPAGYVIDWLTKEIVDAP